MQFVTLKGRKKNVPVQRYALEWDGDSLSKFQFKVKQFLRQYWSGCVMYEELPVAGTRMTIDLFNATRRIAVECDGKQHTEYNPHFHRGSASAYSEQVSRDNSKDEYCRRNGITMVRVFEDDLPDLSRRWFRDNYSIEL